MKYKIVIHDPDWWKPMTEDEVDDFLEIPIITCDEKFRLYKGLKAIW